MTAKKLDDFDATRAIIDALEPFDAKDRERIIRWACEKLGMSLPAQPGAGSQTHIPGQTPIIPPVGQPPHTPPAAQSQSRDIKTFLTEKSPKSNNQLAAAVAYFYMFEAADGQKKNAITKEELITACRLANLPRLKKPEQTLVNAHNVGLLDKGSENGSYVLNAVGENLVAMTMPSGSGTPQPRKKSAKKAAKKAAKKSVRKKSK